MKRPNERASTRPLTAILLVVIAIGASAVGASGAPLPHPLETGVTDPRVFDSPGAAIALRRVKAAGATTVLLQADWSKIAPGGKRTPAGFVATDPGDPHYSWASLDRQVTLATRRGLQPILEIVFAPDWAQPPGTTAAAPYKPDPAAFGAFARAAASRYSGSYAGLPRVRYWQAWNEPNISTFLLPQFLGGQPFSLGWYRVVDQDPDWRGTGSGLR